MKHFLLISLSLLLIVSSCKDDTVSQGVTDPAEAVKQDYSEIYLATATPDIEWTGSVASCDPGIISQDVLDKTVMRINYFRKLAGLSTDIVFDATWNSHCQKAALMMDANGQLSHDPPSSWVCFTNEGASAAGSSNLGTVPGAGAIDQYIRDPGANNTRVGHRRWILNSRAQKMGFGSTDRRNALWVIGGSGAAPEGPEYHSWPPAYVPNTLVYPRWSLSVPNANFISSTVTMTSDEGPISLNIVHNESSGIGDNTIVWEPQGITLDDKKVYNVTVGTVMVDGEIKDISYDVQIVKVD